MKKPNYLKPQDKVAIVCTARKFTAIDAQPAMDLLKSWDLIPVLGSTIGLDNFQLGGSDEERAADFQAQLDNPEIKAIWIARGGYGSVRIIDNLNFDKFLQNPKWIVGFSDITVLHSHINTLGVSTIHGIMPYTVPNTIETSIESLKKALFGESLSYEISSHFDNRIGKTTGELVGGNLSIIYSLLGSESSIDTNGKILYIEDLDEYLYHIDRMMQNLKRNGYFKNLKGLIVGGMTDMHDNSIPFGLDAIGIIKDVTSEYDFPICFDFPAGHVKDNRALRLGQEISFEVTENKVEVNFL